MNNDNHQPIGPPMRLWRDGVCLYNARAVGVSCDDASLICRPSRLPWEPGIPTARFEMASQILLIALAGSVVLLGVQSTGAYAAGARFVLIKVSIAWPVASD